MRLRISSKRGEILLTRGQIALVDIKDHDRVACYNWFAHKNERMWYAMRGAGNGIVILMHRLILNAPPGMDVDHINGDGLDNRKMNLRLVTDSENQQNRHHNSLNTSGFRGVTWHKQACKWQAGIKRYGKSYHLGLYVFVEDAARAYDEAARRIYGKEARTNFKDGGSMTTERTMLITNRLLKKE